MPSQEIRYFVSGASGQLGQRVLELLLQAGAKNIIAGTRSPEKLDHFAKQGVTVRYANFDEASSLRTAFEGVDRLLLISTDILGQGDKRLIQHQNAVKKAEEAGVSHVVYTSLSSADDSPVLFAPDHAGTEKALADSKLNWTVLRANLYMELIPSSLSQAYAIGGLYRATGDGKTAYISREDLAQASASALISDFDGKRILDITGMDSVSQAELAAIAKSITGVDLNFVPIDLDSLIKAMTSAGLPQVLAETYASIDTAIAEGKHAAVSNDYQELTGRNPIRIKDYLEAHKESLAQTANS